MHVPSRFPFRNNQRLGCAYNHNHPRVLLYARVGVKRDSLRPGGTRHARTLPQTRVSDKPSAFFFRSGSIVNSTKMKMHTYAYRSTAVSFKARLKGVFVLEWQVTHQVNKCNCKRTYMLFYRE